MEREGPKGARKRGKAARTTGGATSIEALNVQLAAAQQVAKDERRRAQERIQIADQRVREVEWCLLEQHRQQGHVGLIGLAAVQGVFHFLPDPADVLSAATACRRWRELACADSVWRARFEREGLLEKVDVFEVALPVVEGGGSSRSAATAASERDELAGVGLAFYVRVLALEVRGYYAGCLAGRTARIRTRLVTAPASPPLASPVAACCARGTR